MLGVFRAVFDACKHVSIYHYLHAVVGASLFFHMDNQLSCCHLLNRPSFTPVTVKCCLYCICFQIYITLFWGSPASIMWFCVFLLQSCNYCNYCSFINTDECSPFTLF